MHGRSVPAGAHCRRGGTSEPASAAVEARSCGGAVTAVVSDGACWESTAASAAAGEALVALAIVCTQNAAQRAINEQSLPWFFPLPLSRRHPSVRLFPPSAAIVCADMHEVDEGGWRGFIGLAHSHREVWVLARTGRTPHDGPLEEEPLLFRRFEAQCHLGLTRCCLGSVRISVP